MAVGYFEADIKVLNQHYAIEYQNLMENTSEREITAVNAGLRKRCNTNILLKNIQRLKDAAV